MARKRTDMPGTTYCRFTSEYSRKTPFPVIHFHFQTDSQPMRKPSFNTAIQRYVIYCDKPADLQIRTNTCETRVLAPLFPERGRVCDSLSLATCSAYEVSPLRFTLFRRRVLCSRRRLPRLLRSHKLLDISCRNHRIASQERLNIRLHSACLGG